jgi:hypothetical protein
MVLLDVRLLCLLGFVACVEAFSASSSVRFGVIARDRAACLSLPPGLRTSVRTGGAMMAKVRHVRHSRRWCPDNAL